MGGFDIAMELVLVILLSVTLVHAIRLQRVLGAVRGDRAAFDSAITGFDGGARAAEASLAKLRDAADRVETQLRSAHALKDDLVFLSERGERLADQLEHLVRTGRGLASEPAETEAAAPPVRSAAERNLLLALQGRR